MTDKDDKTIAKTLWSDTLIEILLVALKKDTSDDEVKRLLREIHEKGFKQAYIIDKVRKELDENAARRIKMLLGK